MYESQLPLLPLVLDRVPHGLRQALAQEGIPTVERRASRVDGAFVLFDSQSGPPRALAPGQRAVDVDALRQGWRGDPFEDLLDERSARFAWKLGGFQVSEEIARVNKRAVRRHVMQKLRARIEELGGIWFCVGAFPFPYRTAFNFRFDHDEYDPADFERLLESISGYEHGTSHYVCGSTHEAHPQAIARLRGMDVGSHGYLHHTYQDSDDNLRNIRRGITALRRLGIEPSGFVAPHGRFNLGLLSALETLGVTHTSEFCLAYDELPFFPASSNVLQIPVHPVCLGIFLEAVANKHRDSRPIADDSSVGSQSARLWFDRVAGSDSSIRRLSALEAQRGVLNNEQEETIGRSAIDAAVDAATEHFCAIAHSRYHCGEPIFLYGHPNGRVGRHPRLLKTVFAQVADFSAAWWTTMTQFNDWWRTRQALRVRVVRGSQDNYTVLCDHLPRRYRLAGEIWRGEHVASIALDDGVLTFSPESLAFASRRVIAESTNFRVDAPHGVKSALRRYLDWEKVTPVQEIRTDTWRGWMKRTLRRIKD